MTALLDCITPPNRSDSTSLVLPAGLSRVVFWTDMLSPHLLPYARELASCPGVQVQVAAWRDLTAERSRLGWSVPDLGRAQIVMRPDRNAVRVLASAGASDSVHLLYGIRGWRQGRAIARQLCRSQARFGIVSESALRCDRLQPLRNVVHRLDRLRFGCSAGFVLGLGRRGVRWFAGSGYPAQKLFEFGYITDPVPGLVHRPAAPGPVQLLFVGRLFRGKGLALLLDALAQCQDLDWRLTIVGSGPFEHDLKQLAAALGLAARIEMLPAMPRPAALLHMTAADVLLLPSHPFEGWGAVASEALQIGLPVICSTSCGCADLLRDPWRGEVFVSDSVSSLTTALRRWILRGRLDPRSSRRIRQWADCLSPAAMTGYLAAILRHVYDGAGRPLPRGGQTE